MGRRVEVGQIYRHFKGNKYEIIALAINADNREDVVVYKALYGEEKIFVRSYKEFVSLVDRKKYPDADQEYRFELVGGIKEEKPIEAEDIEAEGMGSNQTLDNSVDKKNMNCTISENDSDNQDIDPGLLAFLETNSFQEKLHILRRMELEIDDRLIDAMAASLDVVVPEGDIQERVQALKNCLATFDRFDCSDRIDKKAR